MMTRKAAKRQSLAAKNCPAHPGQGLHAPHPRLPRSLRLLSTNFPFICRGFLYSACGKGYDAKAKTPNDYKRSWRLRL